MLKNPQSSQARAQWVAKVTRASQMTNRNSQQQDPSLSTLSTSAHLHTQGGQQRVAPSGRTGAPPLWCSPTRVGVGMVFMRVHSTVQAGLTPQPMEKSVTQGAPHAPPSSHSCQLHKRMSQDTECLKTT